LNFIKINLYVGDRARNLTLQDQNLIQEANREEKDLKVRGNINLIVCLEAFPNQCRTRFQGPSPDQRAKYLSFLDFCL
jgi:hypothetical protein